MHFDRSKGANQKWGLKRQEQDKDLSNHRRLKRTILFKKH
jgi:hypothetical protein